MNSDRREWDFSIRALTAADKACVAALLVKLERIATLLEVHEIKPRRRKKELRGPKLSSQTGFGARAPAAAFHVAGDRGKTVCPYLGFCASLRSGSMGI
ncbi:unnamed protein product [Lota lota]